MQPGVLLPDPVWNLGLCRLDGYADALSQSALAGCEWKNGR